MSEPPRKAHTMAQNPQPTFPEVKIHESAYVDMPCKIGKGTKIWHFSHVLPNCEIGENCNIGQNVVVSPDVKIGSHVKIQNNVSVYTGVILEDYVFCGPSMVFTNVINPRGEINRRNEYKPTLVKRGATLGANCTIVCGSTIGKYAFIGAGAVVAKDVPDYAMMLGVPARRKGWACRCGEPMWNTPANGEIKCPTCGNHYKEVDGLLKVVHETQSVG